MILRLLAGIADYLQGTILPRPTRQARYPAAEWNPKNIQILPPASGGGNGDGDEDDELPSVFLKRLGDDCEQVYAGRHRLGEGYLNRGRHDIRRGVICESVDGERDAFRAPSPEAARYAEIHVFSAGSRPLPKEFHRDLDFLRRMGDDNHVRSCTEVLQDDAGGVYVVRPSPTRTLTEAIPWEGTARSPLAPTTVRRWYQQLVHIISYLSDYGCNGGQPFPVHHLSPSDFCFLPDGRLVLSDFPGSLFAAKNETTMALRFMSPQVLVGLSASPAAADALDDTGSGAVWSTAAILYCMLTGRILYDLPCETDPAFRWNILEGHLVDQQQRRRFPDSAARLLRNVLLPADPGQRWTLDQVLRSDYVQLTQEEEAEDDEE